ncbi:UNVERIFIED_CONTAM: hypothetical protein RMT77_019120 [Armadillidium vulgare]
MDVISLINNSFSDYKISDKDISSNTMNSNNISVFSVLKYLEEGYNDSEVFRWIISNTDIVGKTFTKIFTFQFRAFRELNSFIKTLPQKAQFKWYNTIEKTVYTKPSSCFGWKLLFGPNIPLICQHYTDSKFSFLRVVDNTTRKIKLRTSGSSSSSLCTHSISKKFKNHLQMARGKRTNHDGHVKLKYVRALHRIKSLDKLLGDYKKRTNSLRKMIMNKPKIFKKKVTSVSYRNRNSRKYFANDTLNLISKKNKVLNKIENNSDESYSKESEAKLRVSQFTHTLQRCKSGLEQSQNNCTFGTDSSCSKVKSYNMIIQNYKARENINFHSSPHLRTMTKSILQDLYNIVLEIKSFCNDPEINKNILPEKFKNFEYIVNGAIKLIEKLDFERNLYKREVKALQMDLCNIESALKLELNEKVSKEKQCEGLKNIINDFNKFGCLNHKCYNEKWKSFEASRNSLVIIECKNKCTELRKGLQCIKLQVNEWKVIFNACFKNVNIIMDELVNQILSKENNLISETSDNQAKGILEPTNYVSDNDAQTSLKDLNVFEGIELFQNTNRENLTKCTSLLRTLQHQMNKINEEKTIYVNEKDILRKKIEKLEIEMSNLKIEIKQRNFCMGKENEDDICNNLPILKYTILKLDEKVELLKENILDEKKKNEKLEEENEFLNVRFDKVRQLLKEEKIVASNQLDIQLSMLTTTANLFKEQISRLEQYSA